MERHIRGGTGRQHGIEADITYVIAGICPDEEVFAAQGIDYLESQAGARRLNDRAGPSQTNATAENMNGKIQGFMANNFGIRDQSFFFFRLAGYLSWPPGISKIAFAFKDWPVYLKYKKCT